MPLFIFLIVFANRAKAHFEQIIGKYQKEHEIWQIRKNTCEEKYKKEFKKKSQKSGRSWSNPFQSKSTSIGTQEKKV
ncbi:hypothetical protein PNK_2379 [Candidatus Protochlamydia naegleriophila]|uniref:Uncharacterized protein n=1 Tax=Candidatus Protochlamydia naegleriophila TaxID=389348 RepID=A0A0U5JFM3_9BACT|nr:hypothetical protein PNK_2379 [Candidatus Protochlamydia naegleriophila]